MYSIVEVHVCPQLEMATVLPTTMDVSTIAVDTPINPPKDLDAGALLVLKSKGSWLHCGYHLTTSIVAPVLLSLPYAMGLARMGGWSRVASLGRAWPGWGRYFVGPLQFVICYGAVIVCSLLGGQSLKYIYLLCRPNGGMQLYQFIIMFGVLLLFLAQIPSFHALRHINLVSLVLCLAYSACAAAGSIYIGSSSKAPPKDYSLSDDRANRLFGAFNGISIIATTYASGIIPEIQATIAPPVTGKMFKGLCICYTVIILTYFSVGISGYWAFGNDAQGSVLSNFIDGDNPLLPTWFLLMTNVFTLTQLAAVGVVRLLFSHNLLGFQFCVGKCWIHKRSTNMGEVGFTSRIYTTSMQLIILDGLMQVYLQPTNEVLEGFFANPKKDPFSLRNTMPRLIFRSLTVVIGTTIAAMLPFFGDIMALFGALGCIPLDFILPMIFYNVSFKPSKRSLVFWINTTIAVVSSALAAVGAVSSVRQMVLDTKTYHLFANV
ncbi:GABA transporter 1 [Vitis vinifera]|uniref:GABA transporter 1 n=2 Tax=Vitis vinifera TaxID=29760 RepID=A0A438HUB6_VITVI|nr:GABA transporter 1 [Vitis vinifera]